MDSDSSLIYNAIYGDGHFEKVQLGELINKGGAAGKIYLDASHPGSVAKIFHNRNKSSTNRKKLEAMLLNRPNFPRITKDENGLERVQIAWPDAILEDENGFCVGMCFAAEQRPFIWSRSDPKAERGRWITIFRRRFRSCAKNTVRF